jgi:hypothetical protein
MAGQKTELRPDQMHRYYNTTAYWREHGSLIPKKGAIIVYTDAGSAVVDGQTVHYEKVKVGNGINYVNDLRFLGDFEGKELLDHINDQIRHITAEERAKWNHKLDLEPEEVAGRTLLLTREFFNEQNS